MGIEKKIVASVSPENSGVQYQFMLEQRVLRRLCVQKIVVPTPMKDKLDKVIYFGARNFIWCIIVVATYQMLLPAFYYEYYILLALFLHIIKFKYAFYAGYKL